MTTSASPNGIYRTPGRAPDVLRAPGPSWRLLLSPAASATGLVLAIALPVLCFNVVRAVVLRASAGTRFVPALDLALDLLALSLLASPVWLGLMIAGRVAPYWSSLRPWGKISYVAALFTIELLVLVMAEASIVASRTGEQLFEPTLQSTSVAPDGRRAHVYRGGLLSCSYEVYVAPPFALTMTRQLSVPGRGCAGPVPHVRWSADRSVHLVDHAGRVIEPGTGSLHR